MWQTPHRTHEWIMNYRDTIAIVMDPTTALPALVVWLPERSGPSATGPVEPQVQCYVLLDPDLARAIAVQATAAADAYEATCGPVVRQPDVTAYKGRDRIVGIRSNQTPAPE